jgi:hypothetical protein
MVFKRLALREYSLVQLVNAAGVSSFNHPTRQIFVGEPVSQTELEAIVETYRSATITINE